MTNTDAIHELRLIQSRIGDIISGLTTEDGPPEWLPSCINDKGETIPIPQEWIDNWECIYPRGLIMGAIREAARWSLDNPSKRKKDLRRFLGGWISRNAGKASLPVSNADTFGDKYERRG